MISRAESMNTILKNWKLLILAFSAFLFALAPGYAGEAWQTDFEASKAEAAKTGKPMLLDFTGSDWCGWCNN